MITFKVFSLMALIFDFCDLDAEVWGAVVFDN